MSDYDGHDLLFHSEPDGVELVRVRCRNCHELLGVYCRYDSCDVCGKPPDSFWYRHNCRCDGHAPLPGPGSRAMAQLEAKARATGKPVTLWRQPTQTR